MNQHSQEKRNNYIKKLVSNSKAIISHQVAVPLGSQKMLKILFWIDNIEPLNRVDLSVFKDYYTKIQGLPLGTERLSYNKDFLQSEDSKLNPITANYRNKIIEKCFEIIEKYDIKKD
jgi:hypothetical protein